MQASHNGDRASKSYPSFKTSANQCKKVPFMESDENKERADDSYSWYCYIRCPGRCCCGLPGYSAWQWHRETCLPAAMSRTILPPILAVTSLFSFASTMSSSNPVSFGSVIDSSGPENAFMRLLFRKIKLIAIRIVVGLTISMSNSAMITTKNQNRSKHSQQQTSQSVLLLAYSFINNRCFIIGISDIFCHSKAWMLWPKRSISIYPLQCKMEKSSIWRCEMCSLSYLWFNANNSLQSSLSCFLFRRVCSKNGMSCLLITHSWTNPHLLLPLSRESL